MIDDSLLDTLISPADQELAARLTLASIDGSADRTCTGLMGAIADPNVAVAVIGMLTRHLAIVLVQKHGAEKARSMLTKIITEAGDAAEADK